MYWLLFSSKNNFNGMISTPANALQTTDQSLTGKKEKSRVCCTSKLARRRNTQGKSFSVSLVRAGADFIFALFGSKGFRFSFLKEENDELSRGLLGNVRLRRFNFHLNFHFKTLSNDPTRTRQRGSSDKRTTPEGMASESHSLS